jgi:hypothetical protein
VHGVIREKVRSLYGGRVIEPVFRDELIGRENRKLGSNVATHPKGGAAVASITCVEPGAVSNSIGRFSQVSMG